MAHPDNLIFSNLEEEKRKTERKAQFDKIISDIEQASNYSVRFSGLELSDYTKLNNEIDRSIEVYNTIIFKRKPLPNGSEYYEVRYHFKNENQSESSYGGIIKYFLKISPSITEDLIKIYVQDTINKSVAPSPMLMLSFEDNKVEIKAKPAPAAAAAAASP